LIYPVNTQTLYQCIAMGFRRDNDRGIAGIKGGANKAAESINERFVFRIKLHDMPVRFVLVPIR